MKRVLYIVATLFCLYGLQPLNAAAPTTQARDIVFSSISGTQMTLTWTNGNGSARCVFVKYTTGTEIAESVNGTNYTASTTFGSGTQIGSTGWYCVFKGASNTVTVTGLSANRMYRVHVLEYNTTPSNPTFLQGSGTSGNPRSQISGPTTQVSSISFSNVGPTSMDVSMTSGNGSNRVVFRTTNMSASDPTVSNGNTFNVGTTYSTNWLCVYNSTGTSFAESSLNPLTQYKYRAYEYTDNASSTNRRIYYTPTATNNPNSRTTIDFSAPTVQVSGISFSGVTQSAFTVSWTSGNGSSSIVFVAHLTTGEATPADNTTYYAETNFGNGDMAGEGWYAVYKGTGNSVEVTSISGYTTYRVMICSYNGSAGYEKFNVSTFSENLANVFSSSSKVWNGSSWDGGTPTGTDDAEISEDYNTSANINCNNLIINTGNTLNIQAGSSVIVNSDLTNYGQ